MNNDVEGRKTRKGWGSGKMLATNKACSPPPAVRNIVHNDKNIVLLVYLACGGSPYLLAIISTAKRCS